MNDFFLTLLSLAVGWLAATPAARTVKILAKPNPQLKFYQILLIVAFPFVIMSVCAGYIYLTLGAQATFNSVLGMVSLFILRILYACIAPWLPR